jgi:hypothetical protein
MEDCSVRCRGDRQGMLVEVKRLVPLECVNLSRVNVQQYDTGIVATSPTF